MAELHPLRLAGALGSRLRHLLQNPDKILQKYIHNGTGVPDPGCGTGYFTTAIAKMVGQSGNVIAADVRRSENDPSTWCEGPDFRTEIPCVKGCFPVND